ncbi:Smr/MutS family protein, partial [Candidatus Ichthyocystis sparus]
MQSFSWIIKDMSSEEEKEDDTEKMSDFFPRIKRLHIDTHYISRPVRTTTPLYFKNKGDDAAGEENIIGHVFQSEHLYEDDTSDFRAKDVSIKTLKELRRGRWPVEQAIDLHGLTRVEAAQKMESFMDNAVMKNKQCLLIIHGRGRNGISVLRTMVRRGLKINSHSVLAFCSAPQNMG